MKIKKGEIWNTSGRKGVLTVKVLKDIDTKIDDFFPAEIVEGKASYVSIESNLIQKLEGVGEQGGVIMLRTTLTSFLKKVNV